MPMRIFMRLFIRDRNAVAAVEFALVAPIMFALWLSTVAIAHAVRADMNTYNAAEVVANMAANEVTSSIPATLLDICDAAKLAMYPYPTNGNLSIAIADIYNSSVLTELTTDYFTTHYEKVSAYNVDWQTGASADGCGANANAISHPAAITVGSSPDATYYQPLVPNPNDAVIVAQVTYTYSFMSLQGLPNSYTFTETAYSRPRNGTRGIEPN